MLVVKFEEFWQRVATEVSRRELRTMLTRLGINISDDQFHQMFAEIDSDSDGVISFDEFWELYQRAELAIRDKWGLRRDAIPRRIIIFSRNDFVKEENRIAHW